MTFCCLYEQTVQNELNRVERRNKEMESKQRRLYKKMLGTDGDHAAAGKYDVRNQLNTAVKTLSYLVDQAAKND